MDEVHPLPAFLGSLACFIGILFLSYFGLLTRRIGSLSARFLRLPVELGHVLGAERPFNFDAVDNTVVVGRLPRTLRDYELLVEVSSSRSPVS